MTDTIAVPPIPQALQDLFGAFYPNNPVVGIYGVKHSISVQYDDGNSVLFSGLLVGHDIEQLPDGRINFAAPQQGQPFAWAYRLPDATKWSITQIDPTTNHTEYWRTARIIQPLYTGN